MEHFSVIQLIVLVVGPAALLFCVTQKAAAAQLVDILSLKD